MLNRPSSRRPSVRLCVMIALLPLLLAGCAENLAPLQALLGSGTGWAADPALAVEPSGLKHVVWSECASSGAATQRCKLVYLRSGSGLLDRRIELVPPGADDRYDLPSVAVSADGEAYLVWRFHSGSGGPYRYYYSRVRTDGIYDLPMPLELDAGEARPLVAARGNVVYALYHAMPDPDNVWLRYMRLKPLDPTPNYLHNNSNAVIGEAALAIDSGGAIHAAWRYIGPGGYQAIFYGTPGTLRLIDDGTSAERRYSAPAIAIDSDDAAHVVFATYGGSTDALTRWTRTAAGAETPAAVPLAAAHNPWRIHGGPHIVADETRPVIAFSARNAATTNNEIWLYSPPSSGADSGPRRITSNAWQDDEPQIVQLDSSTVVAWRTYEASGATAGPVCQRDLYEYDARGLRQVFASPRNICASGGMLAGSGDWAAGVWIDSLSADSTRAAPWTTFNNYAVYLPLLR